MNTKLKYHIQHLMGLAEKLNNLSEHLAAEGKELPAFIFNAADRTMQFCAEDKMRVGEIFGPTDWMAGQHFRHPVLSKPLDGITIIIAQPIPEAIPTPIPASAFTA